jgi:O-antigen/teichoic acid export membrane protein
MQRPRMSLLRSFLAVLVSGLVVNAATFVILALAPLMLTIEDFAKLTLGVAAVMFLATLLDFGLSITSTRQFAATRDPAYLSLSIKTRLALFTALGSLAGALCMWPEARPFAIALLAAAALNIWTGLRAADQAREDFASFARANLLFSAARIGFAGAGLASGSWIAVMLGLFVVPVIAIAVFKSAGVLRTIRPKASPVLAPSARYARFVFMSAVCYGGLMALPAAIAGLRLDPVGIGTIGLANTFIGPVTLLNTAFRLVLLPRITASETALRPRLNGTRIAMALALTLLCAAGAGLLGDILYGQRFALAGPVIGIMTAGMLATSILGLMNLDVHRVGAPSVEALTNLGRLLITAPILWLSGTSVLLLSLAAAVCLVVGEIVLFFKIKARGDRS